MPTNAGWVPTVLARTRLRPTASAAALASTSRSSVTSRWSQTKPIGATTTSRSPHLLSSATASQMSGSSHRSPPYLALLL